MNNLFKRFFAKNVQKNQYNILLCQLIEMRAKTEVFTLFAQNTGYSWQGVKSAAISLFPDHWIALPHYYSHSSLSHEYHLLIGKKIAELGFSQLIFNGFAPYFCVIAESVKKTNPKIKIKVIYHGFLAELAQNDFQQSAFMSMIDARKIGLIDELGFAKKGLSLTVNKLYGFNSCEIILINPAKIEQDKFSSGIDIGVLVNNTFRKNFHNMVGAAMLMDEAKIHVTDTKELKYWNEKDRVIAHGFMDQTKFVELLGRMTVNLHVTFSEASGGQVCSESISQGVPCISAYSSSFFDYDDYLKEKLIVQGIDDSWYIYQKIEEVLADYEQISKRCVEYAIELNRISNIYLCNFISI